MKKQNAMLMVLFFILSLLMIGCTNKEVAIHDTANAISKLENEIVKLNTALENQQLLNDELKFKMNVLEDSYSILQKNSDALNELVNLTIDYKTAMLNYAEIEGDTLDLNITYTEKVNDEHAPNGFSLVETEEGTATISIFKNVPVYLMKNASSIIQVDWEGVVNHRGLLQLYEKNGEIIFISEVYVP